MKILMTEGNFNNLRKTINGEIKSNELNQRKKEFDECNGDTNKLWKIAKNQVWVHPTNNLDRMTENGDIKVGSKSVANILNRYYVSEVRKIREGFEKCEVDPLINF